MVKYHATSKEQVLHELHSSEFGLSQGEANLRLTKYGLNEIKEEKIISPIKIFLKAVKSNSKQLSQRSWFDHSITVITRTARESFWS